MTTVLIVDGANVVGARPDGWWKDRAVAARRLHEQLLVADIEYDVIVLVLEGGAKGGVRAGRDAHVRTVHAPRDGDTTIGAEARAAGEPGDRVVVVTADRALDARVAGVDRDQAVPSLSRARTGESPSTVISGRRRCGRASQLSRVIRNRFSSTARPSLTDVRTPFGS